MLLSWELVQTVVALDLDCYVSVLLRDYQALVRLDLRFHNFFSFPAHRKELFAHWALENVLAYKLSITVIVELVVALQYY